MRDNRKPPDPDPQPFPMSLSDPLPPPARRRWLQQLPYLSLALFLAAIAALVWLTREYDDEAQRATLISDVLWMEQNLRFNLDRNENHLQEIGPELLATPTLSAQTEARLASLLTSERGLARILWLSPEGEVRGAMPPLAPAQAVHDASADAAAVPVDESSVRLARAIGRPVYGPAHPAPGGTHHFEVHVPVWSDEAQVGMVVGVYALSDVVMRELPWWFSERYHVAVLDSDGRTIAAKSKVAPVSPRQSYSMPFDPPGHGLTLQISAYRSDPRWIPVLLGASIVLLAGIIVWSVMQLRRQLARRQQAEVALRAESVFRKAMEDSMLTGMRARDLEGRLTYVNSAFCRMTGFSAEELLGRKPPMPYWDPERLEQTFELHRQIMTSGSASEGTEVRLRRKNGETLDVLVFEAPLIDASGRHAGWMGSVLDITEQKRAREQARQQEERLQQSSRLITMGEMASTLAHELNQPLAALANYADSIRLQLDGTPPDSDAARATAVHLRRMSTRASAIVRRFRDLGSSPSAVAPYEISVPIQSALASLRERAEREGVRMTVRVPARCPIVRMDRDRISLVFENLITNAIDAAVANPAATREVTVVVRSEARGIVHVAVEDSGTGIALESTERIFEPFRTSKTGGMGLGLPISRSIIEAHGGAIWARAARHGIIELWIPK